MQKFNTPRIWNPELHLQTLASLPDQHALGTPRSIVRVIEPIHVSESSPDLLPNSATISRNMHWSLPSSESVNSGREISISKILVLQQLQSKISGAKEYLGVIRLGVLKDLSAFNESLTGKLRSSLIGLIKIQRTKKKPLRKFDYPNPRELKSQVRDLVHALFEEISAVITTDLLPRLSDSVKLRETEFRLMEEIKLRRQLHNQLIELKGNIRVFIRIRPLLAGETINCISTDLEENLIMLQKGLIRKQYQFDRIFDPLSDNDKMFGELHQLLTSVLDGYNVSILAYGITGSGKTYTMEGIYDRIGVGLFQQKLDREQGKNWSYSFNVSIFEIYNESIIDLLNLKNLNTNLKTNPNNGLFHIPGLTSFAVKTPSEIRNYVKQGSANRSVSSTNCNQQSSRSHLITIINVLINTPNGKQIESKLNLVDLAGSERLDKSGASGTSAKEATFINKSLSALGDVINARFNKASHVPYRNSLLTSSLQETLCGDSKTLMILQVTPSEVCESKFAHSYYFRSRISKRHATHCFLHHESKKLSSEVPTAPVNVSIIQFHVSYNTDQSFDEKRI